MARNGPLNFLIYMYHNTNTWSIFSTIWTFAKDNNKTVHDDVVHKLVTRIQVFMDFPYFSSLSYSITSGETLNPVEAGRELGIAVS